MIFHKQQHLSKPDGSYPRGSCYPTVLACLLDLPLDQVPHFNLFYWSTEESIKIRKGLEKYYGADEIGRQDSMAAWHWYNTLIYWLASRGYTLRNITKGIQQWLVDNPEALYMVSGLSPRNFGHVVIYKGGQLLWDPHPSGAGLIPGSEHTYEILEKIEGA